jgi:hypothetical protein
LREVEIAEEVERHELLAYSLCNDLVVNEQC